ncbi:MAG: hypothetical protein AAF791_03225 [Bacteroidota bacterium]
MIPDGLPLWTYWLLGFVGLAAAAAWWFHIGLVAQTVFFKPFRQADRLNRQDAIMDRTRQHFREGADPTWEDDLNDALRSPAGFEDEPKMTLPGLEAMPDTW